jgi:hypothetical protein
MTSRTAPSFQADCTGIWGQRPDRFGGTVLVPRAAQNIDRTVNSLLTEEYRSSDGETRKRSHAYPDGRLRVRTSGSPPRSIDPTS